MDTLPNAWNGSFDPSRTIEGFSMSDLLTERSLKFYDGTYKWNGEGFVDEEGVYREFSDKLDEQPPTPLPSTPLSDSGGASVNTSIGVFGQEDAADLSDMEANDPGSRKEVDGIRQAAETRRSSGRREAASTPVGATKEEMANPFKPPPVRPSNSRKKGDDSDSDKDKKKKKDIPRSDHNAPKIKKRKKDDDEDEDDKENDGGAADKKDPDIPAEKKMRKDSKQSTTSGRQRRKSSTATTKDDDTEPPKKEKKRKEVLPARKTARQYAMENNGK